MSEALPERKQEKTRAGRMVERSGLVCAPPRGREISAGTATGPPRREEGAITTPQRAKRSHKTVMKRCPEIKPCSQGTFTLKNR